MPPASAVKNAEITKTTSLYANVGTPSAWALSSSSRIALRPMPKRDRSMSHQTSSITTTSPTWR